MGELMGRRGPPPKPTILKILQGNPGGKRLNANEPRPAPLTDVPDPPTYLNEAGKAEWKRVLTILVRIGVVTDADLDLVAIYADTFSKWCEANQFVRERGMFFPVLSEDGKKIRCLQQFPHVNIASRCAVLMVQIGDRLGLNPAVRSRLTVVPNLPPNSVADRLLRGPLM